ncbi:MAG: ubiG 2 [Gammaproteobacteria bacterium]|jgi:2-polyprenyl-6-hydroxyphenyl methylase/3-demethylubiquinone-9 3-methyltransferase|nr:ubiG 2 [Gammaproteobacteria bacterium]
MQTFTNVDSTEIAKFSELAAHWWELDGPCKPLHIINPVRLNFVQQHLDLQGKKVLDIGCGGGIFSESLAMQGAQVTGIDMSEAALAVAKTHCQDKSLQLNYLCVSAEEFATQNFRQFDVITCMELLEHVPDPITLVQTCANLVKPGGDLFFSTINRTLKAYLLTILAAEYIAKLLPKGTHDYAKFIRPSELCAWLRYAELEVKTIRGINYQALTDKAQLTRNIDTNYILHAKP